MINEAFNIKNKGRNIDPKWAGGNQVVVGIGESGKKYVTTTNGAYPSKAFQDMLKKDGYVVVKNAGGLSAKELDADGNPKKWHAEGRLIQNGINVGDRIVGIGVTKNLCASCAEDVKKFNIKTGNSKYTREEYDRLPGKRPDWRKRPKDDKCK